MFGATAAAMNAFKMYGNDPSAAINAAEEAWFNAYPLHGEYGMTAEADELITDKHLCGVGLLVCFE